MADGQINSNGNGKEKDRDSLGRFLPGWKGGPGRPPKSRHQIYLEQCLDKWIETITPEDFSQILDNLKTQGKSPDSTLASAAWMRVLERCLPAVERKVIEADIHTTETHVHVIAEKAQHDSGFRSRLIALDDELRVGPPDGHAEPSAPGANSN